MIDFRIYKKWKVFVCHSTDDKKLFVDSLVKQLQIRGSFLWYDTISIPEGASIHDAVQKGLKGARGGIVIFSTDFIKDHPFEKREWVKEEFHVLVYKRNTEGCFLIPIFYNINPENLPESFNGPLDKIKGFTYSSKKKEDNIYDLSEKIHNLVKKIQSKHNKIILFAYFLIIVFILGLSMIFLFNNNKIVNNIDKHIQNYDVIGKITDVNNNPIKNAKVEILESINNYSYTDNNGTYILKFKKEQSQLVTIKVSHDKYQSYEEKHKIDFSSKNNEYYIEKIILHINNNPILITNKNLNNTITDDHQPIPKKNNDLIIDTESSFINKKDKTEISIIIIDENNNIENFISSEISRLYNESGKRANTGLFKNSFIKSTFFQELFEGNTTIIKKLNLSNFTDYLVIGKIKYDLPIKGNLVKGTFVSNITLNVNVISIKNNTIENPHRILGKWNGVSESQAQEGAINNLLSNYKEEILLIK